MHRMHWLSLRGDSPLLVQEGIADTDKYDEQFDEEGERKQ